MIVKKNILNYLNMKKEFIIANVVVNIKLKK